MRRDWCMKFVRKGRRPVVGCNMLLLQYSCLSGRRPVRWGFSNVVAGYRKYMGDVVLAAAMRNAVR